MSRLLLIGAGGVARVAAYKCVQNSDVFKKCVLPAERLKNVKNLKLN